MSDKKHIDRIFQEKLKDLEATPDAKVWENIQSRLEQPKEDKEKVFPIWFRIGGVAALLLVLLTVGNLYISNKSNTTKTNVVDTENATKSLHRIEEELEQHIRFEERVLFNEIQQVATKEQLEIIQKLHTHGKFNDNTNDKFWE